MTAIDKLWTEGFVGLALASPLVGLCIYFILYSVRSVGGLGNRP